MINMQHFHIIILNQVLSVSFLVIFTQEQKKMHYDQEVSNHDLLECEATTLNKITEASWHEKESILNKRN